MLEQTYPNIEIIVYDDCSTDNSLEILSRYDSKITVIVSEINAGRVFEGTNRMIEQARGKYIYTYDSDDWLEPNTIEESEKILESDPKIDYVYSAAYVHYDDGRCTEIWPVRDYTVAEAVRETFQRQGSGVIATKGLFRASFLKKHGYIQYLGSDVDTVSFLHYLKHGLRTKALNVPLRHYRVHSSSHTRYVALRVKAINSILRYIVANFDPRIYLPEMPENMRPKYLNRFFLEVADNYLNNRLPAFVAHHVTREEMLHCCAPLFESARIYSKGA
jgi:glycosyltransferase involved in cell wall biosynthesis